MTSSYPSIVFVGFPEAAVGLRSHYPFAPGRCPHFHRRRSPRPLCSRGPRHRSGGAGDAVSFLLDTYVSSSKWSQGLWTLRPQRGAVSSHPFPTRGRIPGMPGPRPYIVRVSRLPHLVACSATGFAKSERGLHFLRHIRARGRPSTNDDDDREDVDEDDDVGAPKSATTTKARATTTTTSKPTTTMMTTTTQSHWKIAAVVSAPCGTWAWSVSRISVGRMASAFCVHLRGDAASLVTSRSLAHNLVKSKLAPWRS